MEKKLCYCGEGKSASLPSRPSKDAQRSAVFGDRGCFPLIFVSWRTLWMVFNYKNIDTVHIQSEIRDCSVFLTGSTALFLNPVGQTSWLTDNILSSRRKINGFPCGIYIMMVGWTSKLKPVEEVMETTIHWQAQRIFATETEHTLEDKHCWPRSQAHWSGMTPHHPYPLSGSFYINGAVGKSLSTFCALQSVAFTTHSPPTQMRKGKLVWQLKNYVFYELVMPLAPTALDSNISHIKNKHRVPHC